MDFDEGEDTILLTKTVRDFMQQFPPEYWRRIDSERLFPEEYWRAAARQGLLGITIPEEYGGAGLGLNEASATMMTVAGSGGGLAAGDLLMRTLVFGGLVISRYGSRRVREEYLPRLVRGELICSFAHTEPSAGVNTFAIETRAVKRDGGYVVSGQKIWITLAHMADIIIAVVRTTPREKATSKSAGLSLMLIDAKQEGVKTSRIRGMSLRSLPSNVLYLEDVWVPDDQILG
ncbi:MAG: acyl-CoA dehydrogenase family protein, partial [Nitrososphaerota archaeon]